MQGVIGYYSELEYSVEIDGEEVYQAGNSPFDSQGYVDASSGVGLETMRTYCEQTTKAIANENRAKYIGIELLED